ncbi:hypothetical protein J2Z21_008553 [Streptomyces griseochromogenes]|uniref:Uncharacterized protein n=1 Tax=Streptomyces griseochromogenes TaxID=68214 RepID=A0A1B1B375_9ACTN|nr:hypothetical protein [Streptomyces griseochromogenes]ANP53285.1 hypothetical protein AVL59_30505 [Streptomyces griseochromogenes]MBP2055537.1 hypothetical protein [Streptomyces griseochromogenes]
MAYESDFAGRSAHAVRELSALDSIETETRPLDESVLLPTGPAEARAVLLEHVEPLVADRLSEYYFPAEEVHLSWNSVEGPSTGGEFCITNIVTCLTRWQPPLEDAALTSERRAVLAGLKVTDQEPYAGTGRATGLRVSLRSPEPELWYHDATRSRLERLDLTYGTYLDTVLITKGAFGWQYLFADIELGRPEFREVAENLSESLSFFSSAFPRYDYAPLVSRLEARL